MNISFQENDLKIIIAEAILEYFNGAISFTMYREIISRVGEKTENIFPKLDASVMDLLSANKETITSVLTRVINQF